MNHYSSIHTAAAKYIPSFPQFAQKKFNFPFRRSFHGSIPAVHDIDVAIKWFLCFWQELLALQEAGSRQLQREDKAMLQQRWLGDGSAGHSGAAPAGKEMSDSLLLLLAGVLAMESLGTGLGTMSAAAANLFALLRSMGSLKESLAKHGQ